MNKEQSDPKLNKEIGAFLVLTILFSGLVIYLLISRTVSNTDVLILGLMWSPGMAAILTNLLFHKSLKGLAWKVPKVKYLVLAFILPFAYILVYIILWLTGTSKPNNDFISHIFTADFFISYPVLIGSGLLYALGEEIGWRGFLTTKLLKHKSFLQTSLIAGIIWAIWHIPILYLMLHKSGINIITALTIYSLGVIVETFMYTWFIYKTQSVWPCVVLHASYNYHIQEIFENILIKDDSTLFVIGEFGVGVLLISIILAFILYLKRH